MVRLKLQNRFNKLEPSYNSTSTVLRQREPMSEKRVQWSISRRRHKRLTLKQIYGYVQIFESCTYMSYLSNFTESCTTVHMLRLCRFYEFSWQCSHLA